VGGAACADYHQTIQSGQVDVVSVCIPSFLHSEVACYAAEQGCHILTEKPLALTSEQGQAMIDVARRHGVKLAVSLQYRDGWPARCRQLIQQGAFGGPVILRFADVREVRPKTAMHCRDMNGGPIIDMACHYFDLMRYLTGGEPVSVYARGHVFGRGKARLSQVSDFALDTAVITVEYEGGHILDFAVNWGMPEGFPGYGDQVLMGPAMTAQPRDGRLMFQYGDHQELWNVSGPKWPPQWRIADLMAAIRDDREPEITGEDGLAALRVSLAAIESIETGQVIEWPSARKGI
jgi:predicted dehydrogenase